MMGTVAALLILAQAGQAEVERLGGDDPAVREKAEAQLFELGAKAEPALRKAVADGSPEVRARADRVLRRLEPRILFVDDGELWTTALRGGKAARLAKAERDIGGGWGRPDGGAVAYQIGTEVRLRDLVSGQERCLVQPGIVNFKSFAWSPDGRRALVSFREPYLLNIETGAKKSLESDRPWLREAVWSPDGTRIAVLDGVGDPGEVRYDVTLLDSEGKLLRRVTRDGGAKSDLCWSGDGAKVAYVLSTAESTTLAIVTLETGAVLPVASDRHAILEPSWSPDGGQVAFIRARPGIPVNPLVPDWDLGIVRSDGSDLRILRRGGISFDKPDWSPDGRFVLFSEAWRDEKDDFRFTAGLIRPDGSDYRRLDGTVLFPSWISGRTLNK